MTIAQLAELFTAYKDQLTVGGIVLFILSLIVEFIPKIKFYPWSAIFEWIGSKINKSLSQKLKEIDGKVDTLQKDLDKHVAESAEKELKDTRKDILDFCNSCMNGRRHTKEQFEFIIRQCDVYEAYIKNNNIKNGYVDAAIKEIKRLNDKCIQENKYLKEGEDYEIHGRVD